MTFVPDGEREPIVYSDEQTARLLSVLSFSILDGLIESQLYRHALEGDPEILCTGYEQEGSLVVLQRETDFDPTSGELSSDEISLFLVRKTDDDNFSPTTCVTIQTTGVETDETADYFVVASSLVVETADGHIEDPEQQQTIVREALEHLEGASKNLSDWRGIQTYDGQFRPADLKETSDLDYGQFEEELKLFADYEEYQETLPINRISENTKTLFYMIVGGEALRQVGTITPYTHALEVSGSWMEGIGLVCAVFAGLLWFAENIDDLMEKGSSILDEM